MRICFVVADVRAQQATFAGIYLAWRRTAAGTTCGSSPSTTCRFLDDNNILAPTTRVRAGDYADPAAYAAALASEEAVVEEDTLGSFDVVFLRYNPMREGEGRPGAPLIDFGWRLRLAGTLVVNDPEGLRRAGSRMYLADFPADVRTARWCRARRRGSRRSCSALDGPAVLKPLAPRGGEHVFYLRRRQVSNLNQMITAVTKEGYAWRRSTSPRPSRARSASCCSTQSRIRVGDRVAIYRRRAAPSATERVAAAGGGRAGKCEFGPVEARICDILRPRLLADGLNFVARRHRGRRILELNVFTPGGLHADRTSSTASTRRHRHRRLERRVRLRAAYRTTFDPEAADVV